MALIGAIISSACVEKQSIIHQPLILPEQCIFEKFTEAEKDSMIESVGRKIFRNQKNCEAREVRRKHLIEQHNEAHQ